MDKLTVFENNNIRRVWHNDEWYFSVVDIIQALTDSPNPRNYWSMLKNKEKETGIELYTICVQLKLLALDGKLRETDCANTQTVLRIIQSISSKKAEPFKHWLAKVGHERVEEIQHPESGYERLRTVYENKGYSKEWIDKRLRGMAIRQELTHEWKSRSVKGNQFAALTNEISKATFGKTTKEYKDFKGLSKQSLRDHMTDWELILTMFGEKATTDLTKEADAQGFKECKQTAKKGGEAAGEARKIVEKRLNKTIISKENYVEQEKENKQVKSHY